MTMEASINIAFVGAGNMAREHIRAFADVPHTSLAGIQSRTRGKAEALAREFGIKVVADAIEELHERSKADLVVIAVPELHARGVCEACFGFPWVILLEKPPGYNYSEAMALQDSAQKHHRRLFVGLNRRWMSSTIAALTDLKTRAEPRFIHVMDQQNLEAARSIGHPDLVVQHWMYANSIHVIDLLCCFGRGDVTEVNLVSTWNAAAPGIVLAEIRFASGDLGLYEGIWNGPGPWAAYINTPSRRWELRPLEQAAYQNANERTLQPVTADEWDRKFKPGFRRQAEQVVAAVRQQPSEAVSIEQALRTMRLIQQIFGL